MVRLSKSKIGCFKQCNYRYKLQYIDRLKGKEIPPQLKKGIEVHEILERYNKFETNKLVEAEKLIKEEENYPKYQKIVDNFLAFNKRLSDDGVHIDKPACAEKMMEDKELNIVGVIDAVHKFKEHVLVLDYKTGKKHPITKFRFELSLYAHLYEKKSGDDVTHIGIYFAEHDTFIIEELDRNQVENAKNEIERVREFIKECEETNTWERTVSPLCNWCGMKQNGFCSGEWENEKM